MIWKLKRDMPKCDKCLRGSKASITGIDKKTLRLDIGGAVLYAWPSADGFEISLNAKSLVDGDYIVALWNGETWIVESEGGQSI